MLAEVAAFIAADPGDRHKLTDLEACLSQHEGKLEILDEVQQIPGLFQPVINLINQERRKDLAADRFLLLGSASGELLRPLG